MEKTYKFRAYPNKKQKEIMLNTFGCTRFVYNYYLAKQIELFKNKEPYMFFYDMCKDLTKIKKDYIWLNNVESTCLQQKIKDLDRAYKRYFLEQKKSGYVRFSDKKIASCKIIGKKLDIYDSTYHPKFKKKSSCYNSYRIENYNIKRKTQAIMFENNMIKLPKLGWIKIKDKYVPSGKIVNATVKQVPSGKIYIYLCCTNVENNSFPKTNKQIGIDMGIDTLCSYSNGEKELSRDFLNKSLAKIQKLHKELDRKTRGSSNWEKSRIKLAKAYEKLGNQKKDYIHKLTNNLVLNYDIICVESLDVGDMIAKEIGTKKQKANKRRALASCSWCEIDRQLEYKSCWYGKRLIKIDQYYPSSQICHICGHRDSMTKDLSIREWTCSQCGTIHDRDVNAAINILNEGLKQLA